MYIGEFGNDIQNMKVRYSGILRSWYVYVKREGKDVVETYADAKLLNALMKVKHHLYIGGC